MKGTDKFLIGIVAGIVVLIIAAFAIALTRPAPGYKPEDAAEGVAYNYLLALDQGDYPRAYGYLSGAVKGRPNSANNFARDVDRNCYNCRSNNAAWSVESSRLAGSEVVVNVRRTMYSTGIFGSTSDSSFVMRLQREDDAWKIISSGSYWAYCWNNSRGCSD